MPASSPLSGRSVLVLEDNFVLAESMRFALEELGCRVVGPAPTAARALELVAEGLPDVAVLDIDLQGKSSAPVAEVLVARGVPFLFLTGYESAALLPAKFQSWTRLSKPVDPEELARALEGEIQRSQGAGS